MGRRRSVLVLTLAVLFGCSDDGGASDLVVDAQLPAGSFVVSGDPVVGQQLEVTVAPDLADGVEDWGWHRCIDVPACLTIQGADGPTYTPTRADAWQVLRVIGSTGSRSVNDVVGPIVNPDPEPFTESTVLRIGIGLSLLVAPGTAHIVVDAECPVIAAAGVHTPSTDGGSDVTGETAAEVPSEHHEIEVDGDGGQLTVVLAAEGEAACNEAHVTVRATR